jgi:hypothetical protein
MKIRPVGAELFHADGWTDGRQTDGQAGGRMDGHNEANSHFSQFCKHP